MDFDELVGIGDINSQEIPVRYETGSKIVSFALPGNRTGVVSKLKRVNDNGQPIYEIIDEKGETHEMCETLFDDENDLNFQNHLSSRDFSTSQENEYDEIIEIRPKIGTMEAIDIEKIRQENEAEIERIIEDLDLVVSEDPYIQLQNCCKLQAYMAENNGYNDSVMDEKEGYSEEFIVDMDLHNALINKNGVCTSNSIMFQSVLSRVGISVECIGIDVKPQGYHMSNIVSLRGAWYFFDTTLERSIRQDNLDQELVLCCAGLGTQEYCPYYTPRCIVRRDGTYDLPENISEERIPVQVVNGFFSSATVTDEKSM